MNWLTKIMRRDHAQERIAQAVIEREQAAQDLEESRQLGSSIRAHDKQNHLTQRIGAAFEAHERRHRRHA